jgi:hypothetical protein
MFETDISLHDLQDQIRKEIRRDRARMRWLGIGVLVATFFTALFLSSTDVEDVAVRTATPAAPSGRL